MLGLSDAVGLSDANRVGLSESPTLCFAHVIMIMSETISLISTNAMKWHLDSMYKVMSPSYKLA